MSTAIYARISFDRQDGAGVGRQLEDCRALVEREGWGPAVEYVDNNSSAFSGKVRPRYRELLAAVKAGEHGRIVVWKLDRLYRSSRELEVDLLPLAETGQVTIHAVMAGLFDLATSHGRTMCRVATAFSTQSSEDTRERIKRAKQEAREQGKGNGGPRPFGWKDMSKPHPDEAERVRMAVEDAISGVSLADIARRWNAAGVGQPQTGRANWTADIVHQVLSNPRHAGLIGHRIEKPRRENGGREYERAVVVGEAKWPAIVERSRWEQLQAVLLHRGAGGRVPRRRSLLTGLVSCSACGTTMVRTGARGKDPSGAIRKVWRCPNGRGCGNVSIDAAGLEGLLVEATVIRADTESLVTVVRRQGHEGKQAGDLLADLERLESRMDTAAASFASGRLPGRAFEVATTAMQRERRAVQSRLAKVTSTTALEPYAGHPGLLRSAWPGLSLDQQRAVIGAVLGRVSVAPGHRGRPTFDRTRVRIDPDQRR